MNTSSVLPLAPVPARRELPLTNQLSKDTISVTLSAPHLAVLKASGIDPALNLTRYFTLPDVKTGLELGFAKWQIDPINPQTDLVIRIVNVHGGIMYQLRHTTPRKTKDDKEAKYETPSGKSICLDVDGDQAFLNDVSVPIILVEGAKKADALRQALQRAGIRAVVIALIGGVWGGNAEKTRTLNLCRYPTGYLSPYKGVWYISVSTVTCEAKKKSIRHIST